MNGEVWLAFEKKGEHTRLIRSHHISPLKASRALYLDDVGTASVYLMETSGGMVEGDTNYYHIDVDSHSSVSLIPQSSTKIYPATRQLPSKQIVDISLKEHAQLTWQPETIIPFADSIFLGETTIHLHSSSSLVFSEIFSSGRQKHDESFAFHQFSSKTKIYVDGKLVVFDHLNLRNDDRFENVGMFEDSTYMGTIWFVDPNVNTDRFEGFAHSFNSDSHRFGLTTLDQYGIHFRWLTNDLCLLKEQMEKIISIINK